MGANFTPVNVKEAEIKNYPISDLYKQLEAIHFQDGLHDKEVTIDSDANLNKKTSNDSLSLRKETQVRVLQGSLKTVFLVGRYLGLFPVEGCFERDILKIRFSFLTWKTLLSLSMCFAQITGAVVSFYRLLSRPLSLSTIIFTCFYMSTSMTCILYVRIASRWSDLIDKLFESRLDKYVDARVKFKCTMISLTYIAISIVIHVLRVIDRINEVLKCFTDDTDVLKTYCQITYPWIDEFNLPFNKFVEILLVVVNMVTVMIWFYPDLFIICISLFLSSILNGFNEKIISAEGKTLTSDHWRCLREDYDRIAAVIRYFDEVISGLIFSTFTSNLFFVCFEVYYVLSDNTSHSLTGAKSSCPNNSGRPFYTYEHGIYFIPLVIFMFIRFLVVSLFAAEINSVSLMTSSYLYGIPTSLSCPEAQRFIDRVHGSTVALSGLNFFYITREFVLSIFRTIITYELVLLQLNSNSIKLI